MTSFSLSAENFKFVISAITKLVSEARFHLTADGIQVRAVDPANVAMVIAEIKPDLIDLYEDETIIGVETHKIQNFIKGAKSDSILVEITDDVKEAQGQTTASSISQSSHMLGKVQIG